MIICNRRSLFIDTAMSQSSSSSSSPNDCPNNQQVITLESCSKVVLVKVLSRLLPEDCIGDSKFYKTYVNHGENLTTVQYEKTIKFFKENLSSSKQQDVLQQVQHLMKDESQQVMAQKSSTNKHDRCRLLHLRADPKLANMWDNAHRPKTRNELDNSKYNQIAIVSIN